MISEKLLNIAIDNLPTGIALLRTAFVKAHPNDPVPTEAELIAAEQEAISSSLAKDDRWLASHPE